MNVKSNTITYIIDSGCNIPNVTNFYSYNDTFNDEIGHGTAMVSIIQPLTQNEIFCVKIPDNSQKQDIVRALSFILNYGKPGIISINWVTKYDTLISELLFKLHQNNYTIVCAAGHNNKNVDDVFPACLPYVINVGSINKQGTVTQLCNKPTAIRGIDFYANGTNVPIIDKDLNKTVMSGTSVSSAIVTGLLGRKFFAKRNISLIKRHLKFIEKKLKLI